MNGKSEKIFLYRIANASDTEIILEFLRLHFYPYEPLTNSHRERLDFDPEQDEKFTVTCIDSGTTILALDEQHKLAGVLLSGSIERDHGQEAVDFPTKRKWADIWNLLAFVESKADVCNRYDVPKTLHMHILSVASHWRGYSIGMKMMAKCMDVGKELGYLVASIDCTSIYSIKLAQKLDMDCVNTVIYEDYKDADGVQIFQPPKGEKYLKSFCKKL